jgi:potassium efflux system protein
MRAEELKPARRHLRWFMTVVLPAAFVFAAMEWQSNELWKESLGRLAFMAGLIALSALFFVLLRPSGHAMKGILDRSRGGWLDRSRYLWYPGTVALPIGLAIIAALGYCYTARQLEERLQLTIALVLVAVFVNALLIRWLLVVRRRLAVERAMARRAVGSVAQQEREGADEPETPAAEPPEREESLHALSMQTRRLVRVVMVVGVLIGLWAVWADVLPALGILRRVELWSTTVKVTEATGPEGAAQTVEKVTPITLAGAALALIVVVVTIVAARNLPGLLEIAVLPHLPMERGVRFAVTALSRYMIVVVGVVVAFGRIGVGWSKVQWLIAAMTVGLGFGLQEIFANFISGLIILFERPMRVGDTVTVGDITGTVTRIRIRATTILNWSRKELIVPNKEFITGRLINWTLSDTVLRLDFPVGIAYGSDTALAEKLLLEVARDNPLLMEEPKPIVIFKGFGDSSLEFELRVFIPNMESYVAAWHQVNRAIDEAFRNGGIEIAFPQRDIHVRSVQGPFPIEMKPGESPKSDERRPSSQDS